VWSAAPALGLSPPRLLQPLAPPSGALDRWRARPQAPPSRRTRGARASPPFSGARGKTRHENRKAWQYLKNGVRSPILGLRSKGPSTSSCLPPISSAPLHSYRMAMLTAAVRDETRPQAPEHASEKPNHPSSPGACRTALPAARGAPGERTGPRGAVGCIGHRPTAASTADGRPSVRPPAARAAPPRPAPLAAAPRPGRRLSAAWQVVDVPVVSSRSTYST